MNGWTIDVLKDISIVIPPGTTVDQDGEWVTLYSWDSLPDGPTILEVEIAAELGKTRPTNIQTRLLRPGGDPTKRHTHPVGTIKSFASVLSYLEFVSEADLPIKVQVWQKAGQMTVVKVVAKALTPAAYIAGKLT